MRTTSQGQKRIRDKIRAVDFYITGIASRPKPFGSGDLDDLIRSGRIHLS